MPRADEVLAEFNDREYGVIYEEALEVAEGELAALQVAQGGARFTVIDHETGELRGGSRRCVDSAGTYVRMRPVEGSESDG